MKKQDEELEFMTNLEDDNDMEMTPVYHSDYNNDSRVNTLALGNIFNCLLNQSKHPTAVFFHLLFKFLALLLYIFGSYMTDNFIFTFVLCIIFLAFDFWTVKNISGRLLVGLRWWSYVREDGSNEWIFESLEDMAEISAFDSNIFWGTMYITPIIWILLLIIGIFRLSFNYLPVVIAAVVMNMANFIGYLKCSQSAKDKVRNLVESGMKHSNMSVLDNSSVRGWLFSTLLAVTSEKK